MKNQPNRLTVDGRHAFAGTAIDRTAPLRFRLDGRVVHGFAGDTVLSALLANGIDTAGTRAGHTVGLGARFAPGVVHASARDGASLPMERLLAVEGMDLVTAAPVRRGGLSRLLPRFGRPSRSLDIDLHRPGAMTPAWLSNRAAPTVDTDLVVVGAGLAGLAAALVAAEEGQRVVILEAAPVLGGDARLFGSIEGEPSPDETISRLTARVTQTDAIAVATQALVIAARPGLVRAHLVSGSGSAATGRMVDYRPSAIVLATGAIERLPIFAGNRLPGVMGSAEAFAMAQRYGVWPGKTSLFATVSSPAYRLAMLANNAGIVVPRIADGRGQPESRFIEYCKAFGITLAPGSIALAAEQLSQSNSLSVFLQPAVETPGQADPVAVMADSLIVCGGWQPDLALWHMAGGQSRWHTERARLEPVTGPPGIALAGSAAGYLSSSAVLQSGRDAVDMLLGRPRQPVVEHLIDPIYETPDGPTPVARATSAERAPAYLDSGSSLVARAPEPARRVFAFAKRATSSSLLDQTNSVLTLADVAAGVQIGAIAASSAGIVAQERTAFHDNLPDPGEGAVEPLPLQPPTLVPHYLHGRFGSNAALWTLLSNEARALGPGMLLYDNSDQSDPRQAAGVVLGAENGVIVALVDRAGAASGQSFILRDLGRTSAVTLGQPYQQEPLAPLGGGTGTP